MRKIVFSAVAMVALAAAGPASAHHSVSLFYDLKKEVTVTGAVEEFKFVNPHSVLRFRSAASGTDVLWRAESSPVSWLVRNGWKPAMFKPGTQITITGNPARDESVHMVRLLTVTFADGKKLNANSGEALK